MEKRFSTSSRSPLTLDDCSSGNDGYGADEGYRGIGYRGIGGHGRNIFETSQYQSPDTSARKGDSCFIVLTSPDPAAKTT
eukprot:1445592-Heterocapsa_arctica.AAC.1